MFTQFLPYWRNESSGKLAAAVNRYFAYTTGEDPRPLTVSELSLLKAYLKFWFDYPWQGFGADWESLRAEFEQASTYYQLRTCTKKAIEFGVDPY